MFRYQQGHISFHLSLLIIDNMRKSSKNDKEGTSKEIVKAIRDAEGKKHKDDKLKNIEVAKPQPGSFAGASIIGRTSVSKMKKPKMKKDDLADDLGSDAYEDWVNIPKMGGWSSR